MEQENTLSQDGQSIGGIQRVAFFPVLLLPRDEPQIVKEPFPPLMCDLSCLGAE